MKLFINGEERQSQADTVAALVEQLGMKGDRVAVELNREIVPRTEWPQAALKEGDKLEIVHFVGGGAQGSGPTFIKQLFVLPTRSLRVPFSQRALWLLWRP